MKRLSFIVLFITVFALGFSGCEHTPTPEQYQEDAAIIEQIENAEDQL